VILYVARHGQTAANARRVFQGQSGKGLDRLGRAQVERLGERLRSLSITSIVTSDLERAVETATIVSQACGIPVELDPGLREVDVGTWSGKSYDEIASLYPEEWAAWEGGLDLRRGGGETYAELAERVDAAVRGIVTRHNAEPARRILIVSHGGAIKSWITKLLGVTTGSTHTLGGVSNTGLTVVERDAQRSSFRLHSWNDTAHLQDLVVDELSD
jgi:broad specificity phosphatase PhoE